MSTFYIIAEMQIIRELNSDKTVKKRQFM